MGQGRARIDSPEVIRQFRGRFAAFAQTSRTALSSAERDFRDTIQWLNHEQTAYWKTQLRKRDEAVNAAQREYNRAQWGSQHVGRAGLVDEKRALDLAVRKKEEAERALDTVKKWSMMLEQKVDKLWAPCQSFLVALDRLGPVGLERLDRMLERLDEYMRGLPKEEP